MLLTDQLANYIMGNALKPASDRTFAPSEAHGGGDIELQVIAQGQEGTQPQNEAAGDEASSTALEREGGVRGGKD